MLSHGESAHPTQQHRFPPGRNLCGRATPSTGFPSGIYQDAVECVAFKNNFIGRTAELCAAGCKITKSQMRTGSCVCVH